MTKFFSGLYAIIQEHALEDLVLVYPNNPSLSAEHILSTAIMKIESSKLEIFSTHGRFYSACKVRLATLDNKNTETFYLSDLVAMFHDSTMSVYCKSKDKFLAFSTESLVSTDEEDRARKFIEGNVLLFNKYSNAVPGSFMIPKGKVV